MALILPGAGIAVISGKVAGTVFSRNKGGAYIRNLGLPVNPNTPRQVTVRAAMAFLTARWSDTLTAAQRTAWNLYGSSVSMVNRIGQSQFLSGFNHYIRSNMILKQTGNTLVDAGPVIFEIPAQDPTLAMTCSEATQQTSTAFDVAMDWSVEDGGLMFLFQGQPQNAQINFFGGPWRQMDTIVGIDPGGAASPRLSTVQFPIAEGQHVWIYARIKRADGRLSEPFRADNFCAA